VDGYLKQSTAAQTRTIGPFVDDVDFKTLENALTIANTDILIKKNGAASAAKNSGGATADGAGGLYAVTWDATDTATVGQLSYSVKVAGALVAFGTYTVLEEEVYDDLFAASAVGYLKPTTAGRDLDVSAGGEAGLDWANIGSPTTAQNLSATNIDVDQIVASVSGAVGSVTGAVGSVTGNVGGNVAGSVASVTTVNGLAAGVITAASIATGAIDADALAADAVDEIWDEQIGDGTITSRQAFRVVLAALAAKLSGAATTTVTIRNVADSANVIVATVDSDGNRSATTVTP
jgi:hypothetical protein